MKCPRQDPQNLKPNDIFEVDCPQCGTSIEFWNKDTMTKCPKCNAIVENPRIEVEEP